MIGDQAQYRDLVTLYGTYGDEELIELARGMDDLTAMAQEVLKGELTRRRIPIPSPNTAKLPNTAKESDSEINRFVDLAPQDCIWEFAEAEDAMAAASTAGRTSWTRRMWAPAKMAATLAAVVAWSRACAGGTSV